MKTDKLRIEAPGRKKIKIRLHEQLREAVMR